ncbi:terminase large subunit domain-containing protein [Chitinophaga sancti]|uniref:Terminase family protein n=1 Tax=Chitinophaga sancti TaxID=1004 RepID=A0A1K1T391_9BACT|nr:terminase family protein [Chitinophaga sancti]WQD61435.1 terminase family protein [Chitinophaga sancti]WQD61769.1 terminase family protein [Chitinophaga sancti]WQG92662.1 terminase family protein [Chitinophaga sancti]WQG93012.1 terminase family protein [Chitinophaga sancti]SFW90996.1 Terminase-like family protein [Chitinophaga sancti]
MYEEEITPIRIQLKRPHVNQQKILSSNSRFKVICAGRRFGKSDLAQIASVTRMLSAPKTFVGYVAPNFDLCKKFFKEFVESLPAQLIKSENKAELQIEFINQSFIKFHSGEALQSFRSRKYHLVIIDEAAFIPDLKDAYEQSIRPTLTDFRGQCIFISTPRGENYFSALFHKGLRNEDGYESFHFTSYDNPFISPEEIDEAQNTLPSEVFKQEFLAEPSSNSGSPFGGQSTINKNVVSTLSNNEPICFGIDLGKSIDHSCIIGLDNEKKMAYFDRFRMDWNITKQRIKSLNLRYPKAHYVIDATGLGSPIVDDLQLAGINNLVPFKFTGTSKPQIILELILAVEKGEITYNEITAKEMSVFEFTTTASGHIRYSAASGYNDDTIASLAMANSYHKHCRRISDWKLYRC